MNGGSRSQKCSGKARSVDGMGLTFGRVEGGCDGIGWRGRVECAELIDWRTIALMTTRSPDSPLMAVAPLYVNVITQLPPRISSVVPRADTRGTWHSADSRVLVYEECWYSHGVPRLSDFVELKQKQFFLFEILTIRVYLVVPPPNAFDVLRSDKINANLLKWFFYKVGEFGGWWFNE